MQDAFAYCAELVRTADRDRFIASLFAPAERRGALHALYAFNAESRACARLRTPAVAGRNPHAMVGRVDQSRARRRGDANPVAAALLATIERYVCRRDVLLDLIEARRFDLYDRSDGAALDRSGSVSAAHVVVADLACGADPLRGGMPKRSPRRPASLSGLRKSLRAFPLSCRAAASFISRRKCGAASGQLARPLCRALIAGA